MENYLCLPSDKLSVLFEVRLAFINKELEKLPPFSWSMPGMLNYFIYLWNTKIMYFKLFSFQIGRIVGHASLSRFLNSEEQRMTYSCIFNSKYPAEEFCKEFEGLGNGYSLNIQPFGSGEEAFVILTKTKEYYDQFLFKFKDIISERDKIENFLNKIINQNDI